MTVLCAAREEAPTRLEHLCEQLWELWGQLRPKLAHRPPSDSTLVLYADALILFVCPNAYVHLLRDALTLRLGEYKTRTERLIHLKDCIKWAELTSKRVWLNIYNEEPEKPGKDWWRRTACSQGLLASNHRVYPLLGPRS